MGQSSRRGRIRLVTSVVALLVASTSLASAGGFALREQSAYGQGSSFAGVAAGGSLSSSYWNPATLSDITGLEIEQVASFIFPISNVNVTGVGDQGDIGRDGFVPSGYAAYRWNEKLVLGVAVNGPFGLRTKYPMTSPVRAVAGTSEVFSLNVNPMVSYQVTDTIAVGVGAQFQYFDVRLTSTTSGELAGDDFGIGFTAGIQWKPMEGTEIGLGYRSFVEHDLKGTLSGVGSITVPGIKTPDVVSLGVRQRINDAWTAMATVEWTNWSRIGTFPIISGGVVLPGPGLPFDYNDGWFASVGAEYAWNDQLTLRGGVGWEWSPLDDGNRSFRLPDDDRLWLSVGGSYEANDRLSFDLGYSFLTTFDTDLLPAAGGGPITNGPFAGSADATVHIFSAAFKYKLGG